MAALAGPMVSAGVMTASEAARLATRPGDPDFLGCGFAFIGAWGRRAGPPASVAPSSQREAAEAGVHRARARRQPRQAWRPPVTMTADRTSYGRQHNGQT